MALVRLARSLRTTQCGPIFSSSFRNFSIDDKNNNDKSSLKEDTNPENEDMEVKPAASVEEQLRAELASTKDHLLRTLAEMENVRKIARRDADTRFVCTG